MLQAIERRRVLEDAEALRFSRSFSRFQASSRHARELKWADGMGASGSLQAESDRLQDARRRVVPADVSCRNRRNDARWKRVRNSRSQAGIGRHWNHFRQFHLIVIPFRDRSGSSHGERSRHEVVDQLVKAGLPAQVLRTCAHASLRAPPTDAEFRSVLVGHKPVVGLLLVSSADVARNGLANHRTFFLQGTLPASHFIGEWRDAYSPQPTQSKGKLTNGMATSDTGKED